MSTAVDILCFIRSTCKTPDNELFTVKYALNLETLVYIGNYISQIAYIFSHLKLCVAVARHNFKWLKI